MISLADALSRWTADRYERLGDDEKLQIDDVLEAAGEWSAKRLPIHEFSKIGGILSNGKPSAGYTRMLAFVTTPRTDPRWDDLRRAINALLVFQGFVVTTAGVWSREDLATDNFVVHSAPVVDPWSSAAA